MELDDLMAAGDAREREEVRFDPTLALEHLDEARVSAVAEHDAAQSGEAEINERVRYLRDVESRFVRRRDHFLAAGEADPANSRQAAELAGTAERLRQGIERILIRLTPSETSAAEQARKAAENIVRIDAAVVRLKDAIKSLELVSLEEASRDRITALERTSFDRLAQLGGAYGVQPAAQVASASAQADIDFRVREVTRLAHEAEALAELQRERLS